MISSATVSKIAAILDRSLVTLWIGGLWVTGYLYAPMLFSLLEERATAGSIAGMMFQTIAWVGLCTIPVLLMLDKVRFGRFRKYRSIAILLMLLMIVISQFYLTPEIRNLREAGLTESTEFAMSHAVSGVLYLLTSIIGLYLIVVESQNPD